MLEAQGIAEAGRGEDREEGAARERAQRDAADAMVRLAGPRALDGCRARSLERLREARAGRLDEEEARAVLGSFPRSLARYGLEVDGRTLAAPEVVDVLYLARWNVVFSRPLVEGLDAIARRAYHGWLALHAENAPIDARRRALVAYAAAGGRGVEEARARLAFLSGDAVAAAELYDGLARSEGRVRDRNHALAALVE